MHKPHTMNPQLLKAVSTGDADLLAQILPTTTIAEESHCTCLEGVTAEGSSALHIAARHGYLKLVEMICDQDLSLIKARNNLLDTPLICAARAGHVDVVDYLMKRASAQKETEYVLRAWNSAGATAVHESVRNGHASVLGKLVSRDPRLAAVVDGQDVSPLYMAVVSNRADMVHILIGVSCEDSVKSPASYAGPDGLTALHAAVFAANAQEMCKSLQCWERTLGQKADNSGRTALHYAAASGKTEVVKLLLVNSLLAYIPDDDGLYPVHYAAIGGYSKIIREIMEICPNCDELVDKKHRSILHCAVESGSTMVVWYICRNPKFTSIMNVDDSEGNTPLHLAVKHGHLFSSLLLMMDLRVNLGLINHKGLTPLDLASNENTPNYSFLVNAQLGLPLLLCKAHHIPSNLARNLRYNHCLEDEKESSRYNELFQIMSSVAVFIASVSFTAVFTPPSNKTTEGKDTGMSPFLRYFGANSVSFCYSAIAACLLAYASLATTPIRRRGFYLGISSVMIFFAIASMFATFASAVRSALDPQRSWREFIIVYFPSVFELLMVNGLALLFSVLVIPVYFRVLMRLWTSKHPWQDICRYHWLLVFVGIIPISVVIEFITVVISVVKRFQPGNRESCSWPGCHDATFLHPT